MKETREFKGKEARKWNFNWEIKEETWEGKIPRDPLGNQHISKKICQFLWEILEHLKKTLKISWSEKTWISGSQISDFSDPKLKLEIWEIGKVENLNTQGKTMRQCLEDSLSEKSCKIYLFSKRLPVHTILVTSCERMIFTINFRCTFSLLRRYKANRWKPDEHPELKIEVILTAK